MTAALLLSTMMASRSALSSDSLCPSAGAVEAALGRIVVEANDGGPALSAEILSSGTDLAIDLYDASGALVGRRNIAAGDRCQERAAVAAVVIASWERELRAQRLEREQQAVAVRPPAVTIATPPAIERPPARRRGWDLRMGARALSNGQDGGTALGGLIGAAVDLVPGGATLRPGLTASLSADGERSLAVGLGRGLYRRASLAAGLGLAARLASGLWFEPHVAGQASLVTFRGEGFPVTLSGRGTELAGVAGIAVGAGRRGIGPFASVDARRFVVRSELTVPELGLAQTLPAWELELTVGISYAGGR